MTSEGNSMLQLKALGRPFQLGMLYDIRTNQLIPRKKLWTTELLKSKDSILCQPKCETKFEISTGDTFNEKSTHLGIEGHLKLSVLSGLIQVGGSAKYLNDHKTTEQVERVTFEYSATRRFEELSMTHLGKENIQYPEIFRENIATHVVTGVLYGADAFFIFERQLFSNENHSKIGGSLKLVVEKLPQINIEGSGELNLDDNDKKISESLTCKFYGDFRVESNPSTFKDSVLLYNNLPKLLGDNGEHAVVKEVWLYPLYLLDGSEHKLFHEISNNLVDKSIKTIESLQKLKVKVNDLKGFVSGNEILEYYMEQLSTFDGYICRFETDVKEEMKKTLPQICRDSKTEEKLYNQLTKIDASPFNEQNLHEWIKDKNEEIRIISGFVNNLVKQENIQTSQTSFFDALTNSNYEYTIRLVFHLAEKADPFLNEFRNYLQDKNDIHQNMQINHWYKDNNIFELIYNNIEFFRRSAETNVNKKNIKYYVGIEDIGNFQMEKGITVTVYHKGRPTKFNIPSKPGQPHATSSNSQQVTLAWSKPVNGSENIQKYKIYSYNDLDNIWRLLLTTRDATESIVISNIVGRRHQFKVQGVTMFGDTDESETSDEIEMANNMKTIKPLIKQELTPKVLSYRPCAIIMGKTGAGKTTLVNTLCGTTHEAGEGTGSITRELFRNDVCFGDNTFSLIDTPGTNSSTESYKHAILLREGLTATKINTIFIVVKFDSRFENMVDNFFQVEQPVYHYTAKIVVIISQWDQSEKPEISYNDICKLFQEECPQVTNLIFYSNKSPTAQVANLMYNCISNMVADNLQINDEEFFLKFNIYEMKSRMKRSFIEYQQKATSFIQDYTELINSIQSESNEDKDEVLHMTIVKFRDEMETLLKTFQEKHGDQMIELDYYAFSIKMQKENVKICDEFVEKVVPFMTYNLFDNKDPRNLIKRCPYCGLIWFKTEGCDGKTSCGKSGFRNRREFTRKSFWKYHLERIDGKLQWTKNEHMIQKNTDEFDCREWLHNFVMNHPKDLDSCLEELQTFVTVNGKRLDELEFELDMLLYAPREYLLKHFDHYDDERLIRSKIRELQMFIRTYCGTRDYGNKTSGTRMGCGRDFVWSELPKISDELILELFKVKTIDQAKQLIQAGNFRDVKQQYENNIDFSFHS